MEFFHKVTRFPFMRTRKVWYGLSAILIVSSLGLVVLRGLNLGVDFTGGVVVETNFPQAPNIENLRSALAKAGVPAAQVQAFGSSRDILVRLPPDPNVKGEQIGARILEIFKTVDPGVKLQRTEVVGPQVGQELFVKGAWALVATLVLILIYVLLRFTPKLALGAIFAVLHDPICVVGFFALTQITFDLTAVSAILAVIGYSLNDTVIVFDRVRERARNARKLADRAGDRRIHQSNPVANLDDQAGDAAGRRRSADLRRGNSARIFRGAGHRHSRGNLFVDLHLRRARPGSGAADRRSAGAKAHQTRGSGRIAIARRSGQVAMARARQ